MWSSNHYQLGASINNLIESRYNYPVIDVSQYSSSKVTNKLLPHKKFVMERQAKLEAGIFTIDRSWSLDLTIPITLQSAGSELS